MSLARFINTATMDTVSLTGEESDLIVNAAISVTGGVAINTANGIGGKINLNAGISGTTGIFATGPKYDVDIGKGIKVEVSQTAILVGSFAYGSIRNNGSVVSNGDAIIIGDHGGSSSGIVNLTGATITAGQGGFAVRAGAGNQSISNSGTITGKISLGDDNDSVKNSEGTILGIVDLGAGFDQFTGGAGNETIVGGAGMDIIDGGGGDNTVVYSGKKDSYKIRKGVDAIGITDYIIDSQAEGADVLSNVRWATFSDGTFELAKIAQVDKNGTEKANTLTGNSSSEVIRGFGGNDKLSGKGGNDVLTGGSGKDTLTGGAGEDEFHFDLPASKDNVDKIVDFSVRDDSIHLDQVFFKKAGPVGVLSKDAFWKGKKAHDKSDRIIYDNKTGVLLYDGDGSGKKKAVKIADLSKNLKMTHLDFFLDGPL